MNIQRNPSDYTDTDGLNDRQRNHAILQKSFETEHNALTGDQFELMMMYPDGEERNSILQRQKLPESVPRLTPVDAVIDACMQNHHSYQGQEQKRSLWLDGVEQNFYKLLGLKNLPAQVSAELLKTVPCIGSSLDLHYGVDGFFLAWKPEFLKEAIQFNTAVLQARSAQMEIDIAQSVRYQGVVRINDDQRSDAANTRLAAARLLDDAFRSGNCAIATFDISYDREKEEGTIKRTADNGGTKADLLVTETGGVFHGDFQGTVQGADGVVFGGSRDFSLQRKDSRRAYLAMALDLILKQKYEKPGSISQNIRYPGKGAEWTINRKVTATREQMQKIAG